MDSDAQNGSGKNRRPHSKILKIVALVVGVPLLLLIVAFAVVVVPDQVRPVAKPVLPPLPSVVPVADATPLRLQEVADRATTFTAQTRELYSLPDMSDWPEDVRAAAREWDEAMADLYRELMTLPEKAKSKTFKEAETLDPIVKRRFEIAKQYAKRIPEPYWTDLSRPERIAYFTVIIDNVMLRVHIEQEDWFGAAVVCMDKDWESEVYYWRRMGGRGRITLSCRTIQREHPSFYKKLTTVLFGYSER